MRRAAALGAAAIVLALACRPAPPEGEPDACAKPEALAKLEELRSILRSRNDNDPRLDRDFTDLSAAAKCLLRREYAALPRERLNERGTIVYILGMKPAKPADWEFLRGVAAEPPCLSLSDCAKPSEREHGPGDEITLAYPSLVAVRQAARSAAKSPGGARAVLEAGRASRSPAVMRLSRTLDGGATAR